MENNNLFQVFSNIFIESQQAFNKTDLELRTKCRVLSERLTKFVEQMEEDPFNSDVDLLLNLEEELMAIMKLISELEDKRSFIKESVSSLKSSTQKKIRRR